jgi:NADPH-dependent curcumin reductase CurA
LRRSGIEAAPQTFLSLFRDENFSKLPVKVAE